jgi:hypothetical protein
MCCDAGSVACTSADRGARATLQAYAAEHDLAIMSLVVVDKTSGSELSGHTVEGAAAGKVVLRDRPYSVGVSPDGEWVAWDNRNARPWPEGASAYANVLIANATEPARLIGLNTGFGGFVAISSKARYVALVNAGVNRSAQFRLVVIETSTARVENDVTPLITGFPLSQAIRLGLSDSGSRLVAGSAQQFMVIDLASRKLLLQGRGRNPSLSPDGESLAFMNEHRQLVVANLSSGLRRTLLGRWWRTVGVGAWSPDGKYLLAGVVRPLSLAIRLVAVEFETNVAADVMPIGDLGGARYVWIKNGFLSSQRVVG